MLVPRKNYAPFAKLLKIIYEREETNNYFPFYKKLNDCLE